MTSYGDRVGMTNGFLKLPHVTPRSDADHAANARELERVVNNIPAGAPAKVYYGDVEDLDGIGTAKPITVLGAADTPVVFALPAGITQIQASLLFSATGDINSFTFTAADTPQGTTFGSNAFIAPPSQLPTDSFAASWQTFLDSPVPQEIQFEVSVVADDPETTTDMQWAITITPGIRG